MKWRDKRHLSICLISLSILVVLLVALYRFSAPLYDSIFHAPWNADDDLSGALYDVTKVTTPPSQNDKYIFKSLPMKADIFHSDVRDQVPIYLSALERSVRLIHLPANLSRDVINRCRRISTRSRIDQHQHSVELHFPRLLHALSLVQPSPNSTITTRNQHPALFTYVATFAYHAIYCTRKSRNKEDWTQRDPYWLAVAEHLSHSVGEYGAGMSSNFLVTASHPLSGPSRIHPAALSYLHRATFLRTDFDVSGSSPKDIIVPYYTPQHHRNSTLPALSSRSSSSHERYKYFVYFTGGDNPIGGFRSRMKEQVDKLTNDAQVMTRIGQIRSGVKYNSLVHFSTETAPFEQYMADMSDSVFCLCVRGDTTSSRRLFTAITLGCIPVLVADWVQLPFERLIDYSRFTVRVPESATRDMPTLMRTLLESYGDPGTVASMQAYLADAAKLLTYPDIHSTARGTPGGGVRNAPPVEFSLLNPVTLTLVEALMRRQEECRRYAAGSLLSPMCAAVMDSLKSAKARLQ